jgi:hypothetical protein
MKKHIVNIILLLPIIGIGQISFFKSYGGPGNDFGEAVVSTADSHYVAVGASESFGNGATDLYAFKVDSLGEYVWSRTFGGPNIDYGTDVVELDDGSFLLTGYSNSFSVGYDMFLVKIQSNGSHQWTKNIGGSDWDFCYAAHKTRNSTPGIILAGETYSYGNGKSDAYLIKVDNNGDTLWTKTFGGTENDYFKDVIEDEYGDLICIGTTNSNTTYLDNDLWIVKTDSDGNELWNYIWSDTLNEEGMSICLAKNGNYYFAGNNQQTDRVSPYHGCLDLSGNLVFSNNIFGTYDDFSAALLRHSDSLTYTIICNSHSFGASNSTTDVLYAQLYETFTITGLLGTSGTFANEWVNGADTTADHCIIIVGTTDGTLNGQSSAFLMKKDTNHYSPSYTEEIDLTINEIRNNKISLFPNPVINHTYINSNSPIKEFFIYNTLGELIINKKINGNSINLENLKAGIYILKAEMNSKEYIKFIKL